MTVYNTAFSKDYSGVEAHKKVENDFNELYRAINDLGILLRPSKTVPYFEKNGNNYIAENEVLLAEEMPLAQAGLRATKWEVKIKGKDQASISLVIRHFKGPKPSFPKLEKLVKKFNLIPQGTSNATESIEGLI